MRPLRAVPLPAGTVGESAGVETPGTWARPAPGSPVRPAEPVAVPWVAGLPAAAAPIAGMPVPGMPVPGIPGMLVPAPLGAPVPGTPGIPVPMLVAPLAGDPAEPPPGFTVRVGVTIGATVGVGFVTIFGATVEAAGAGDTGACVVCGVAGVELPAASNWYRL